MMDMIQRQLHCYMRRSLLLCGMKRWFQQMCFQRCSMWRWCNWLWLLTIIMRRWLVLWFERSRFQKPSCLLKNPKCLRLRRQWWLLIELGQLRRFQQLIHKLLRFLGRLSSMSRMWQELWFLYNRMSMWLVQQWRLKLQSKLFLGQMIPRLIHKLRWWLRFQLRQRFRGMKLRC